MVLLARGADAAARLRRGDGDGPGRGRPRPRVARQGARREKGGDRAAPGPDGLPQGRAGAHPRGGEGACGGSARGGTGGARRPGGARRRPRARRARGAGGPAGGGAPRGRPGRRGGAAARGAAAGGPAAAERELRGVAKRRHARLRNAAAGCFLVVRAKDGNKGDAEGDESTWLRCDSVQADGVEAVFEVTQGNTPDTIRFKSMANALFVEMVPPTRRLGWVLRAVVADPSSRNVPTADFRREGNAFKAIASGGAITVIVDGAPRDSNPVRGHGNKPHNKQGGSAGDRYAQFSVEYLDDDALSRAKTTQERVEREQTELMTKPADVKCEGKCVVSYGLYGSDPKYTQGAVRNSELIHKVFPGWTARFYHREDVPEDILNQLRNNGAELVLMSRGSRTTNGAIAGMFWRFLVADDASVERFIVRDSDSRLNAREAHAVAEWMKSGKKVHTIRDHPNHDRPLNGGLWGGVRGCIPGGLAEEVRKFSNKQGYGGDLQFLNEVVWPRVKHDQMAHDAYTCRKYPNSKPFPTKRPDNYQHVGLTAPRHDGTGAVGAARANGYMRGLASRCRAVGAPRARAPQNGLRARVDWARVFIDVSFQAGRGGKQD